MKGHKMSIEELLIGTEIVTDYSKNHGIVVEAIRREICDTESHQAYSVKYLVVDPWTGKAESDTYKWTTQYVKVS